MICNKCNHNLPDDSIFCQYCGNKIEEVETAKDIKVDNSTTELIDKLSDPDITPDEALNAMLNFHTNATTAAAKANSDNNSDNESAENFGLVPENPVFTLASNSVDGEKEYLVKLRTETGDMITYSRRGSTSSTGIHGITDVYNTYLPSGEFYKTIYINMYGGQDSQNVPTGFVFMADSTVQKSDALDNCNEHSFAHLTKSVDDEKHGKSISEITDQSKITGANFCYKCGTKCVTGASFCYNCGALLRKKHKKIKKISRLSKAKANNISDNSKLLTIINFAFQVCLAIYACFAFLAVALLKVKVNVSHKGFKLSQTINSILSGKPQYVISSDPPSADVTIYLNEVILLFATIFAVAIVALSVISFILEFKKNKNNITELFSSILRLVISMLVTIVTIVLLCVCFS